MPFDTHCDAPDAMQGYVALIGAILRQALADTRLSIRHGKQGHTNPTYEDHEDARALLLSRERLTFFCELVGAEVTQVQPALLTAAGLPSPMPRGSPVAPCPVAPGAAYALATLVGPSPDGGPAPGRCCAGHPGLNRTAAHGPGAS